MTVLASASSPISDEKARPPVVELRGVGVRYNVPRGGTRSIKEFLLQAIRGELRFDAFWALHDVNASIGRGERVGVIGRNGAGKSTLLQVIAGVLPPTTGSASVRGRVAPLLQLGAGFDPELSGRENVFLNGALLGMRRAQIKARFDAIVEFAELEAFIDAPLRTYSTGMAARLGFAVAAECQPDVLLLDEVLSVGDEAFQEKCTQRLREFTACGTTMVIVTHNPEFVVRECTRAIWIHDKRVLDDGDPEHVVSAYHRFLREVAEGTNDAAAHVPLRTAEVPIVDGRAHVPSNSGPSAAENELPIPPSEMRELIGQPDPAAYDNARGEPVFDFVEVSAFRSVFEFRCGCGRLARQLIQQRSRPVRYVGIDPHQGMVGWCQRHLAPAADGFSFLHQDVFDYQLNPGFGKPRVLPFPVEDASFSFVEAWAAFPHLAEDAAVFYLNEVSRILAPDGVFHSTWFLFDKADGFPMMHARQNALYANDADPTAAVIFDRSWLRSVAAAAGLQIYRVWPVEPAPRGFQWHVLMARPNRFPEAEWPADTRG
ncbi:MAG: ATP-binding cassette domain-containing protein [Chloroflexi bacterium]|nr:ATP-binding cassette domain-containing protein [Chloroflexota bacterium]